MVGKYFQKGNLSFKDKIFALDYSLIFLVLLLGAISFFAMYDNFFLLTRLQLKIQLMCNDM